MARLGPFANERRVVVGVSGGADSMALALLLAGWGAPLACIVDHGLRTGSCAEAALTAERLAARGIAARVVQADLRPGPGLAGRARAARYGLLRAACREAGCADLLVAHHAVDQAETVRMRADAGSGPQGLAGMAAITYLSDIRLLRPLLGVAPGRLRATLAAAGLAWAEDPTNQDRRTLRARLRSSMSGDDVQDAFAAAASHGAARRRAGPDLANELAEVAIYPEGYAHVPGRLGPDALSALVWTVSGQAYPPPRAALAPGLRPRTLHGVLIQPAGRLGPGWVLAREPAAVRPPVPAAAGARWDGRFTLAGECGGLATLGALGRDAARFRRISRLPAAVLQGLPAIRRNGEMHVVPHLAFPDAGTCRNVRIWFDPPRPAAGASFLPA